MRATAPIPTLSLLVALGASLCACAHGSQTQETTKEEPEMATEDQGSTAAPPKLDAEAVLSRILELVRSSKGIGDFTAERISQVTGLKMTFTGSNRFGAGEQVDDEWRYSIEMDKETVNGPQFMFSFDPVVNGQSPPSTGICKLDLAKFSSEMERLGFTPQTNYGEHGMIVSHGFDSDHMFVSVTTQGAGTRPSDGLTRECIRMVIIN